MRRRSPLQTLLRVAELQEGAARGQAAHALAASSSAAAALTRCTEDLADAGLAGGTRHALETTTRVRLLRADSVSRASTITVSARKDESLALSAWMAARRRRRLFEELAARQQAAHRAQQDKVSQRLADDVAAVRRSPT